MIQICIECGKTFNVKPYLVKKGYGKFCNSKCYGKWQSKNCKKEQNSNWKSEMGKCSYCSKSIKITPYLAKTYEKHFCNIECRSKWQKESDYMKGNKNPAWLGGHSQYRGSNWNEQKEKAMIRDNYICQICDSKEDIVVHHKKPYHLFDNYINANELNNLITLCRICHGKVEIEFNKNNKEISGNRRIPHLQPPPKECEKCGDIFIPKSHKNRWCIPCRTFTCKQCGKIFVDNRYRERVFCSRECDSQYKKDHAKWTRKCKICKKEIRSGSTYCKHCFLTQIKPASKSRFNTSFFSS